MGSSFEIVSAQFILLYSCLSACLSQMCFSSSQQIFCLFFVFLKIVKMSETATGFPMSKNQLNYLPYLQNLFYHSEIRNILKSNWSQGLWIWLYNWMCIIHTHTHTHTHIIFYKIDFSCIGFSVNIHFKITSLFWLSNYWLFRRDINQLFIVYIFTFKGFYVL